MNQSVCVIGLGYIGLPTAALLSNKGFDVHGVDVVPKIVDIINSGEIHIIEPELDQYVKNGVSSKKLVASTNPTYADIFIIAVPTPFHEGYRPNIDYVISASGVSMYEQLSYGFKPIVIPQNRNQKKIAKNLCKKGLINLIDLKGIKNEKRFFKILSRNKNFYERSFNNKILDNIRNGLKNTVNRIK